VNLLSQALERCFTASDPVIWQKFIRRLESSRQAVSYYPSAGNDFQGVLCQNRLFLEQEVEDYPARFGSSNLQGIECFESSYRTPDVFLLSDYTFDAKPEWHKSGTLYSSRDKSTRIEALHTIELTAKADEIQPRVNPDYVAFRESILTSRAFYLRAQVTCPELPEHEVDLLYFCYENVNLLDQFILPNEVQISHLTWKRDGSGKGGGRLHHGFLLDLIPTMQTKWFFVADYYLEYPVNPSKRPSELDRYLRSPLNIEQPTFCPLAKFKWGDDKIIFTHTE
jgi:hypothetical protein